MVYEAFEEAVNGKDKVRGPTIFLVANVSKPSSQLKSIFIRVVQPDCHHATSPHIDVQIQTTTALDNVIFTSVGDISPSAPERKLSCTASKHIQPGIAFPSGNLIPDIGRNTLPVNIIAPSAFVSSC